MKAAASNWCDCQPPTYKAQSVTSGPHTALGRTITFTVEGSNSFAKNCRSATYRTFVLLSTTIPPLTTIMIINK